MGKKQILIICGEASGDMHAAGLAEELQRLDPRLSISAVGGEKLKAAGADVFFDIASLSVMGFFDVLRHLPRFLKLKKYILQKILELKPAAVILVDFSGFNLRLAKAINNTTPVYYYISPQVWASRPGRVQTIKRYISNIIVFFEFEREFYKKFGVEATCVGHPLLDIVRPSCDKKTFSLQYGLTQARPVIALLPGSRTAEIARILPVMLKATQAIIQKYPATQILVARVSGVKLALYKQLLAQAKVDALLVEGKPYDCLYNADFALVCSGTATLETAIMATPFCIVYKMGILNYLLYRPQVKVPYIGMVNIVAQKKVIPEFIQFQATHEKIAAEAVSILENPLRLAEMEKELSRVKSLLGTPGAAARAAEAMYKLIS